MTFRRTFRDTFRPTYRSTFRQGGGEAPFDWTPLDATDVVSYWDAGSDAKTAGYVQVGGYDLVPASDHYFSKTSGTIPGVSSGTPSYPITVVAWVKVESTAVGACTVVSFSDGTTSNRLTIDINTGTNYARCYSSGGGGTSIATGAVAVVNNRWACLIGVWGAANARAIYTDVDTTGGTESTSRAASGVTQLHVGRLAGATGEFDGVVGPIWVLAGDLSGAGNATARANIFAGANPITASGFTAHAYYPMDNDGGADASGNGLNLTAQNSPTAQSNLIVLRDQVGTYHLRATTSAPTWSASAFSNRGGAVFTAASSQFLVHDVAAPVTAAPFQMYAVARSGSTTADQAVAWIGDKDVASDQWVLEFAGAVANDPIRFVADDAGSVAAATSTTYSVDTDYLLWGLEASATSRAVRLNNAGEGTETTSTTPDSADRIAMGQRMDSTPSLPLGGQVGMLAVLSTASTADRANFVEYVNLPVDDGGFGLSVT